MPDRDEPEGWAVRQRTATLAALSVVAMLLLLLAGAGVLYDRTLRPRTHQAVALFPAPGLETAIHAAANDPLLPSPTSHPDPALSAAKRRVARGLADWRPRP